ncbi:hypothetical protein BpHYR1_004271 [Brachionus plicatilis]|uniref:Uncharacterized protein n=1 Tax=Brachionus plicatilis TaxID=10195 RepID=A0A3M7QPR0_BRAPC|nr:hypothetical protein BpHYR1_004271 [Brachionus plicatilis]
MSIIVSIFDELNNNNEIRFNFFKKLKGKPLGSVEMSRPIFFSLSCLINKIGVTLNSISCIHKL